jgi:hypothetical protein
VAGKVLPDGSAGRLGEQLVATSAADVAPSGVVTVIVGAAPKPDVASMPVTLIVIGAPLRTGFGVAAALKAGSVVSMTNVRDDVTTFPA